ncbi:HNH endonuclease signature motif containing protein [Paenibacillus sp. 2TAB23]|uniref:HNH endonuclease signature motif containing protein n=1 Tax=Paenibacillus sp. 2TAB23 TaxID=3233004 RepID=UPI003F9DB1FD
MSVTAKKSCSKVGCNKLTRDHYCEDHAKAIQQSYDKERGTAYQRGYGSQWRKARIEFLRKHPLTCTATLGGLVIEATVVDHITPHKGDKVLFWERVNWQVLCKPCHDSRTAREDGRFGK